MTLREAVIQVHLELGKSREEAELKAKLSDGFIPDAATLNRLFLGGGKRPALRTKKGSCLCVSHL